MNQNKLIAKGKRECRFVVTGGFDIDQSIVEHECSSSGAISSLQLADGRIARLVVGLELEGSEKANGFDEETFEYLTNEGDMADLGFTDLALNWQGDLS